MVNRVLRRHREPDVSNFTDPIAAVVLDAVQGALDDVLVERTWSFQVRHDGALVTQPSSTLTTEEAIIGFRSFNFLAASLVGAINGDFAYKIVFTSKETNPAELANTSFFVTHAASAPPQLYLTTETDLSVFFSAFPDTDMISCTVYSDEYGLPDTVSRVLHVRHEQRSIRLMVSDSQHGLDSEFPSVVGRLANDPQLVAVGGMVRTTGPRTSIDFAPATTINRHKLRMRIYPPPLGRYVLHYSYIYKPAAFALTTDRIEGIPRQVLSLVEDLAYARTMQSGVGNEPEQGIALEALAIAAVNRLHGGDRPAIRNRSLRSHDHRGSRLEIWPPDTVESL